MGENNIDIVKDEEVKNSGGAVLKPEGVIGAGLCAISEMPYYESAVHLFVGDFDFKSIYPSIEIALNISRATTLFTVESIQNSIRKFDREDIHDLFSCLISLKENAVYICNKFFNLPSYTEMEKLIDQKLYS